MSSSESLYRALLAEVATALPSLTGTAKQVAWAGEVRASLVPWIVRVLDTMDRAVAEQQRDGLVDAVAEHQHHRALLLTLLSGITDAGYWIDMRGHVDTMPALVLTRRLDPEARRQIDTDLWWVDNQAATTPIPQVA